MTLIGLALLDKSALDKFTLLGPFNSVDSFQEIVENMVKYETKFEEYHLRDYVDQITNGIVGDYHCTYVFDRNGTFIKKYSLVKRYAVHTKTVVTTEEVPLDKPGDENGV